MKKTLAIVMALIMVLACTNGLATSTNKSYVHTPAAAFTNSTADTYEQNTDGWLQVIAGDYKLNVTVPLVIIFQTSLSGTGAGTAATGTNYAITNNSTIAIAVEEITFDGSLSTSQSSGKSMTLDSWTNASSWGTNDYDKYAMQISWKATTEDPSSWSKNTRYLNNNNTVDFEILGNGASEQIKVEMKTSKLTFMTKADDANERGLKFFNISYKVKISNNALIGDAVQDPAGSGSRYDVTSGKI